MSAEVYDNPDTMRREVYVNGELVTFVRSDAIPIDSGHPVFPYAQGVGDWEAGRRWLGVRHNGPVE